MKKTLILSRNVWPFLLIGGLLSTAVLLAQSSFIATESSLPLALSIDLVITIPFIYFLAIRKTSIPKTTIVPIMVLGLILGLNILPEENQAFLLNFKSWVLPLVEFTVLGYIIYKVRKLIRTYKEEKTEGLDFYTALQQTSTQLLPKPVARLFSTEIAVIYYTLFKWKRKALKENEFSYHKKSGTPALLGAMIFIVAVETFVLHILLESWNPIVAWVLSGLSLYTLLQILGFAKALGQRPIQITNEYLYLNYGILAEAKIPLEAIISIDLIENDEKRGVQLSPLGDFETPNLMIQLNDEITVYKLYGKQEKTNIIRFFADDAEFLTNYTFTNTSTK